MAVAMALPLVGAALVLATGSWPDVRDGLTFVVAVATFGVVTQLYGPVTAGARPELVLAEMLPGVPVAMSDSMIVPVMPAPVSVLPRTLPPATSTQLAWPWSVPTLPFS